MTVTLPIQAPAKIRTERAEQPEITQVQIDTSAVNPLLVMRRAVARKEAKRLQEDRENVLGSIKPFRQPKDPTHGLDMPDTPKAKADRIIDLPQGKAKRIDAAFKQEVQFNIAEPEPAVRAGARDVPEHLIGNTGTSTVDDFMLIEMHEPVPLFEEVTHSDGTVTRIELTSEQLYRKQVKNVFGRAFTAEKQSLADFLPQRVRVAWRMTRELARMKRLIHPEESLANALVGTSANPDPWQVPESWTEPRTQEMRQDMWPEVVDTIRASECLEPDYQIHLWVSKDLHKPEEGAERRRYVGFALLPPAVPPLWKTEEGETAQSYDPQEDTNLNLYMSAMSDIADRLQIPGGSRLDPDQGRLGLQGMLDPYWMRMVWPTRTQILLWEAMIVEETLDQVVQAGTAATRRMLKEKYGLTSKEVLSLLSMANDLAQGQTTQEKDSSRAIMILRLEEYTRRSKDALDLKAEMMGLKQLSTVLGLTDTQHTNPMLDFIAAVQQVESERGPGNLAVPMKQVVNEADVPQVTPAQIGA